MFRKILLLFVVVALIAAWATYALMNMRTWQLYGGLINRVPTEEKIVALTFDDGPTMQTPWILHVLDSMNVKATFFLVGESLAGNMTYGRMIVQKGHELGNHSYSHRRMIFISAAVVEQEIENTNRLIREAGYTGAIHFRPPYGKKLLTLPRYLHQHGIKTIMWDVNPDLAKTGSPRMVSEAIRDVKPGSIILLHVMTSGREESRKALTVIVGKLKEMGYNFMTVSELLAHAYN